MERPREDRRLIDLDAVRRILRQVPPLSSGQRIGVAREGAWEPDGQPTIVGESEVPEDSASEIYRPKDAAA